MARLFLLCYHECFLFVLFFFFQAEDCIRDLVRSRGLGYVYKRQYVELVSCVRAQVKIPLAVKLSPYFTALPNFARKLVGAGANGLVLFNRFYQPDLDIETLEVVPDLVLSTSDELRLPLRWTAILYGRLQADLALTTGVHSVEDVVKATMAGARVSMMASELLSLSLIHI